MNSVLLLVYVMCLRSYVISDGASRKEPCPRRLCPHHLCFHCVRHCKIRLPRPTPSHLSQHMCQCDIMFQCIAATLLCVAVHDNSSKTAMKRSSGIAARPNDCAEQPAHSSAEQPAAAEAALLRRLWLDIEDLLGMVGENDVTMITPFLEVIWDCDWEVLRYKVVVSSSWVSSSQCSSSASLSAKK